MLKPKQTTRKFYNKWLYKATLKAPGVAIFRLHSLEAIPHLKFDGGKNIYSIMSRATANKEMLIRLSIFLCSWDRDLWSKRIESGTIDIYTNSKEMFDAILSELEDSITSCYSPSESSIDLLENTGSIVAKKYPHGKYHYKAFLMPHRIKDKADKQSYIQWIESQGEKILISDVVKDWFIKTEWNWDRRYLLVEDEPTLLMLKLRNPEALGRVYDYIISDK